MTNGVRRRKRSKPLDGLYSTRPDPAQVLLDYQRTNSRLRQIREARSDTERGRREHLDWERGRRRKLNELADELEVLETRLDRGRQEAKSPAPKKVRDRKRRSAAWWEKAQDTMPGYRLYLYEFLSRVLRQHLKPGEQAVVFFVFDRTAWWRKEWETIRYSQFENGSLPREDGTRAFCGCGLSRSQISATVTRLVDEGVILRRAKAGGNGLMEYSLPRADRFKELPRFANADLRFTAPLGDCGRVSI